MSILRQEFGIGQTPENERAEKVQLELDAATAAGEKLRQALLKAGSTQTAQEVWNLMSQLILTVGQEIDTKLKK